MANDQNRHRILYLLKFFQEKSDEKNGVTIRDMQSYLLSKGINADRRTLYRDIRMPVLPCQPGFRAGRAQTSGGCRAVLQIHDREEIPEPHQ